MYDLNVEAYDKLVAERIVEALTRLYEANEGERCPAEYREAAEYFVGRISEGRFWRSITARSRAMATDKLFMALIEWSDLERLEYEHDNARG